MILQAIRSIFIRQKLVEYYTNNTPITISVNNFQIEDAVITEIGKLTVTLNYEHKINTEAGLWDEDNLITKEETQDYSSYNETVFIPDIISVSAKIIDSTDIKNKKSEFKKLYES